MKSQTGYGQLTRRKASTSISKT